jgi:hypothetical protein
MVNVQSKRVTLHGDGTVNKFIGERSESVAAVSSAEMTVFIDFVSGLRHRQLEGSREYVPEIHNLKVYWCGNKDHKLMGHEGRQV